jgi:hypothetical protein
MSKIICFDRLAIIKAGGGDAATTGNVNEPIVGYVFDVKGLMGDIRSMCNKEIIMKKINTYFTITAITIIISLSMGLAFAAEEATSIMCDNGTVNIGDMDATVQDTCGEPNSQDMNQWVYNFGPSQPVYTLIFKEGQLIKILESEWGS